MDQEQRDDEPLTTDEFNTFCQQYPDPIDAHRQYADQLYRRGHFNRSLSYLFKAIQLEEQLNQRKLAEDYNKAAATWYALGNLPAAVDCLQTALSVNPDNVHLLNNYGTILQRLNNLTEAEKILQRSLSIQPNQVITLDALTDVYCRDGKFNKSIKYGQQSLKLKDQQVCSKEHMASLKSQIRQMPSFRHKPPPFNPATPEKNIIAFSLWGNKPQYLQGAITNAMLAPIIYPGWSCRFYCQNDVPITVLDKLKKLNANVIVVPPPEQAFYQLFWRFLVANDPNVERFLIRDCDSLINPQERNAVDEWLQSKKYFHLMRDFYTHTELICAGLWGGVGNVLPSLKPLINAYCKKYDLERTIDQRFLREYVWPLIKPSYLSHDSLFSFGNWKPFPKVGQFPEINSMHVGQNFVVVPSLKCYLDL